MELAGLHGHFDGVSISQTLPEDLLQLNNIKCAHSALLRRVGEGS